MTPHSSSSADPGPSLPVPPIDRLLQPIVRFMRVEAAGGVVLLVFTVAALVLANSPWAGAFLGFWNTPVGISLGPFEFKHSLQYMVNDGLMVIFFFVVGMEVKREMVVGELREIRRAMLPVVAAAGGMIVPACIYLALQYGRAGQHGWGIPMATDIAFVGGCMALLGPRVPHGLRVMLLSLAIIDDIGAILVIAFGYSGNIHPAWLGAGFAGLGGMLLCRRLGIRNLGVYVLLGVGVWIAFHESGVHATIAGVLIGLITPARSHVPAAMHDILMEGARRLVRDGLQGAGDTPVRIRRLQWIARESVSPADYLIDTLHPWVAFVIMPVFALANAGVPVQLPDLASPVAVAVILGLALGKPIGVVTFSWIFVRLQLAALPRGVNWRGMIGAGCLAGIGFTMALFIAALALEGHLLDTAKIGVLSGSVVSAIIGMLLLRLWLPARPDPASR